MLLESLTIVKTAQEPSPEKTVKTLGYLVELYDAWGDSAKAGTYRRELSQAAESAPQRAVTDLRP